MDEFTLNKIIAVMDNFGVRLKAIEDGLDARLQEEIRSLNSQIVILRGRLDAIESRTTEPESAVANPAKKRGWSRRS